MNWKLIITFAIASILGWLARTSLGSYAKKKSENLATKQDIGEITRTVEDVKSEVATSLELIKWELGKKATIHRLAAEREFEALTEIAKHLYEIQLATENLRPTWIQRTDLNETEEQEKEKYRRRRREWAISHDAFADAVQKNRPFLPKFLYTRFSNIGRLSFCEASDFDAALVHGEDRVPPSTLEQAAKNVVEMSNAIDTAIASIRERYEID
jgi:hypothetical protein